MIYVFDPLECRTLLSAAYDLIGLTALRSDQIFKDIDGRGVAVAVIDTGLDTTHPLLSPNYLAGADLTTGGSTPTAVFAALNEPKQGNFHGAYQAFLRDQLLDHLPPAALPLVQVDQLPGRLGLPC